jgi:hypothetical protein
MHLARMSNAVDRCHRVVSPGEHAERYVDDLVRVVDAERVDLVVPVSEESMFVAGLRHRVGSDVDVFCGDRPEMLTLHDKFRFIETARGYGLPVPDTFLSDCPAAAAFAAGNDFVSKPRYSSSGRNVRIHRAGDSIPADRTALLQQLLGGPQVSSFSIVRQGEVFATSVYRGVVMDGSVAVCFERVAGMDEVESWIGDFAAASRHTGFLSFDFILGEDGVPRAIECNPRVTSGIHFVSTRSIAPAILGAAGAPTNTVTPGLLTESYSCLTAALKRLPSAAEFSDAVRYLRQARDVTWSRDDPWPFLLMMINTSPILARSIRHRQTFAVSAVQDIEWRDAPAGTG